LFNWKCIMTPSPILDYIIVHEMCHLVHLNHSKEFWQLLKRVLPDYEERKNSLKNDGIKYDL
ncbi:MAG: M48 family metallopeptidase, partial [Alkaliphilus sp.]